MLIRAEQMQVFETAAEDNFTRRVAVHLRESYPAAMVRLPDSETTVNELPEEKLNSLVEIAIERARSYQFAFESSIAAYTAVMFEVSPNFDRHRLSQVVLTDANTEPEARLNELFEILDEKNWETIRAEYDVSDWQPRAEKTETAETPETAENAASVEFAETVMNINAAPTPSKPPVAIDDINFDATIANYEKPNANRKPDAPANADFPDTILNISKE